MKISLKTREMLDFGYWMIVIGILGTAFIFMTNEMLNYAIILMPFLLIVMFFLTINNKKGLQMKKEEENGKE